MESSKKVLLSTIGVAILIVLLTALPNTSNVFGLQADQIMIIIPQIAIKASCATTSR